MQKTLPIHFAPLQGYTDVIYRNAHAACFGGIDTYYTPFYDSKKAASAIETSGESNPGIIRFRI